MDVLLEIGLERVANLNLMLGSSELISQTTPADPRRYRSCGNWYVKTHSSTSEKHSMLERIGRRLGIALDVTVTDPTEVHLDKISMSPGGWG